MNDIFPKTFLSLLGGIFSIIAAIFIIISMSKKYRFHSTRIFAILLVFAVTLFSNHWSTYFASLFIIATAITELEFLQNLAAIISRSKEYFEYKKEFLKNNEIKKGIEDEDKEIDKIIKNEKSNLSKDKFKFSIPINSIRGQTLHFVAEQLALTYLEREFKKPIQRNVRYVGDNDLTVEVDGVIDGSFKESDIIFEIKLIKSQNFNIYKYVISRIIKNFRLFKTITGRKAKFWIVFIINDKLTIDKEFETKLKKAIESDDLNISYKFLSFDDIGLGID